MDHNVLLLASFLTSLHPSDDVFLRTIRAAFYKLQTCATYVFSSEQLLVARDEVADMQMGSLVGVARGCVTL